MKIPEFYDKEDNSMKHPSDSYVYVNGKNAVIRFSKDLGMSSRGYAYIEDKPSQISDKKTNSKGDLLFVLKVDGGDTWLEYNLRVTLFKNTNKCFVQLIDRWANEVAICSGILEPVNEPAVAFPDNL